MGCWGEKAKRAYHHTAPVNSLYELHKALVVVQEEGLENCWVRHKKNHLRRKEGLSSLGITFIVAEQHRLPQLNAVSIPKGVSDSLVRGQLLNQFNLEIGAGLGRLAVKVWRIGLMGHAWNAKNVDYCINALASVLKKAA